LGIAEHAPPRTFGVDSVLLELLLRQQKRRLPPVTPDVTQNVADR
jgi:hypothetical protein